MNQAFDYKESALIVDNEIFKNAIFSKTIISSSSDK